MVVLEDTVVQSRKALILKWYEGVFPLASQYIQKRGGTLEEAKDLFQEALVLYYEKSVAGNFSPEADEEAYLLGIVKKLWLKNREKHKHTKSLENVDYVEESVSEPKADKLLLFLKQSSQRCMDLLQSFYYEKMSMKSIGERFGYRSERSATVQKYKCLERLRKEVKDKSLQYEDFLN
ncbi:MAG: sigma-70 family RNA polymerase sigma factor [Bacteroidota bacterium]